MVTAFAPVAGSSCTGPRRRFRKVVGVEVLME
jgi:hypothetical protein